VALLDCAGQPRAAGALLAALSRGRLAQAYLFSGPEGSGKRRVAMELAKATLCQAGSVSPAPGRDACGSCSSCLAVEGERHPDVEFFRPEKGKTSYPVRQVREEIRERAYLKPSAGTRRFLVIERAEALVRGSGGQNEGADTLLKLLEEPPRDTILILLASHPERLPDTVRSRCQLLRFDHPDPAELAATLATEVKLDPSEALFLVRLAGGDLAVARGFVAGKKKDKPDTVAIRETLLTAVRSAARLSYPDLFALAAALDAAARGWPAFTGALGVLATLYRDAAIRVANGEADSKPETSILAFPAGPEAEATRAAAAGASAPALTMAARRILGAQEDSRRYPARLLLLEVLFLDLGALLEPRDQRTSGSGVTP